MHASQTFHNENKLEAVYSVYFAAQITITNITPTLTRVVTLKHLHLRWSPSKLARDSPCEVNNATDAKVIPSP